MDRSKEPVLNHPLFEIVTTTAGAISIRNKAVNEIMHNPVGPWAEANSLYIEQSGLKERLMAGQSEELVVFDVGLGAAANALAVLHCAHSLPATSRPLRMVSFERDLELLRFALAHADQFEHFQGYEKILTQMLETHQWSDEKVNWELREGDFLELIDQEPWQPHLILFDPYSPKVNTDMWTTACFRKLYQKSRKGEDQGGTVLFTYSRATPIRAAILTAGFYVGSGSTTGLKDETTQAATRLQDLKSPLTEKWLGRWQRSGSPYPYDCTEQEQESLRSLIIGHPQFAQRS